MQKYEGQLLQKFEDGVDGIVAPSIPVVVYNYPSLTLATIYSVDNITSPPVVGSTLQTDSNGKYFFFAEDGEYQLDIDNGAQQLLVQLLDTGTLQQTLANKVDTEVGKGLSSNDFTGEYRTKVDNIDETLRADVTQGTNLIRDVKHVPSIAALRLLDSKYDGQQISLTSYYDGWAALSELPKGGGIFSGYAEASPIDDDGVNIAAPNTQWVRQFDGDVTPEMFGAYRDGLSDDTSAFNAASLYAKTIVTDLPSDSDQSTAIVRLSAGNYRIQSGIAGTVAVRRYSGVSFKGSGSGVCWVNHYGSGTAFKPEETGSYLFAVRDEGYSLLDTGGNGECGFHGLRMIRTCAADDVVIRLFFDNWRFNDTWTFELNNCIGFNARQHNINAGSGTGELFINGGRYDVSESHNIYMNSAAGELILNTGAGQFSKKSGVRVDSARTVVLRDGFFEGNCIGSLTDYYLHLNGNGDTLSSCVIDSCAINDLADANRAGLGSIYVDNFESFYYRERWVRNAANSLPVLGSNVQSIDLNLNNAGAVDDAIAPVDGIDAKFAAVKQLARPFQWYGKDMNSGPSVSIPTRSTACFHGVQGIGVAIGSYSNIGAVQAFGAGGVLQLNPYNGSVAIGQNGALIAGGTNTFTGTVRLSSQSAGSNITPAATTGNVLINTSGGGRSVTLTNITPLSGREITICKTTSDSNVLNVNGGGPLINGVATLSSTAPNQVWVLIGDGTNWVIKSGYSS